MLPPPLRPRRHALFLDFDGTLVEIAAAPQLVQVNPELPHLLSRLAARMNGAVAILSGRPVAELASHLAPFDGAIIGQHGLEQRGADGRVMGWPGSPAFAAIRRMLTDFAAETGGVSLEDKGATLALHFRQAPTQAEACRAAARRAVEASGGAFELAEGKMVVELLPEGSGKGGAIAGLTAIPPFSGRIPIFVGDDSADEQGFEIIHRLGGISIHVGGGGSIAHYRLATVGDVLAWLAGGLEGDGT